MVYTPFTDANITSIVSLFTYANTVTNDWFMTFTLVALFAVSFISMYRKDMDILKPLAASSFLTTVIAILLRGEGLISDVIVTFLIIFSVFILFLLWRKDD